MTEFVNTGTPIQRPRPATWAMCPAGYRVTSAGTLEAISGVAPVDDTCGCPTMADKPDTAWLERQLRESYQPPIGWRGVGPRKPNQQP
jgi:hypothetical protein